MDVLQYSHWGLPFFLSLFLFLLFYKELISWEAFQGSSKERWTCQNMMRAGHRSLLQAANQLLQPAALGVDKFFHSPGSNLEAVIQLAASSTDGFFVRRAAGRDLPAQRTDLSVFRSPCWLRAGKTPASFGGIQAGRPKPTPGRRCQIGPFPLL